MRRPALTPARTASRPNQRPHDPRPPAHRWIQVKTPNYGLRTFASLFTNRQLTALTTFSDLVGEARERVLKDALAAGVPAGDRLEQGGTGATAYADAVATYLGLATSRCTDYSSTLCTWINTGETMRNVFGRQAVPMVWDYAEANIVAGRSGGFSSQLGWVAQVLELLPATTHAEAKQADAAERPFDNLVLSTDPPYYDNIGYSDLSDYFYVWLRRSLRSVHPQVLGTMLVPKAEELVANPYRHGGRAKAETFFESGFERLFARARATANVDYPSAVYYAFKQSESTEGGESSTGWATILNAIVRAGWQVTATWPVRSERGARLIGVDSNALASSIVIAIRPREADAVSTDRRGFLGLLRQELPTALRALQASSVAPVDLAQASIGPGMAIFSRFAAVIEPTGESMSVRAALQAINSVLDEVLGSQDGDFDTESRWCVAWFEGHGFDAGKYGEAETLANAKNASLSALSRSGVLQSGGGSVRLLAPSELSADYDPLADDHISLWEVVMHLGRVLQEHGLDAAGRMLAAAEQRGVDMTAAHELAYLLFAIAERRGMTDIAIVFNALGSSWADVRAAVMNVPVSGITASTLDFDGLDD